MLVRDVEDALDNARYELQKALDRRGRLERDQETLEIKASKLRVVLRQGVEHLRNLRKAEITVMSEYESVRNLTESARLELESVNGQLALHFAVMANNTAEIKTTEKAIHDLTELLCKFDNNVVRFPTNDIRRSTEED